MKKNMKNKSIKIWVVYDQDNEVMNAFTKKPTLKFLREFYTLDDIADDAEVGKQIAEELFATIQETTLY